MPDRVNLWPVLIRVLTIVGVFVTCAVLAGMLWEWWWDAPIGIVYQGQWFLEPAGPDVSFDGTALYVLIALPLGLVLGWVASLRPRHEIATLLAVLLASVVGALLIYAVGHAMGPADPHSSATGATDYTYLPASLVLGGSDAGANPLASTALLAMPFGAMCTLAASYILGRNGSAPHDRG